MTQEAGPLERIKQERNRADEILDRIDVYYAMARFLVTSALPTSGDEDDLVNSIMAAYPPSSVAPIGRL
jgi:hypothetical protein